MVLTEKYKEIIRFGIVGIIATALHYGIYLALNLVISANVSYTIGYLVSFVCNFILSNWFTFKTKPTLKKGVGFGLSHVVNYLLHMFFLNLFIHLGVPESYAPIPVFLIVIPINFILVRTVLKSKKL